MTLQTQLPSMIEAWLGYIEQHPDAARLLFTPVSGDPEVEGVQRELYVRQRRHPRSHCCGNSFPK